MPTDTFTWQWEEAFQHHGFGDGDDPQHNMDIAGVLEDNGWQCQEVSCIHNNFICQIQKGDVTIEFDGEEEYSEIRKKLPKELVAILDQNFTDDD